MDRSNHTECMAVPMVYRALEKRVQPPRPQVEPLCLSLVDQGKNRLEKQKHHGTWSAWAC